MLEGMEDVILLNSSSDAIDCTFVHSSEDMSKICLYLMRRMGKMVPALEIIVGLGRRWNGGGKAILIKKID